MTACSSSPSAGSCAGGPLAPREDRPPMRPDGVDPVRISDAVVDKVAAMLADEVDTTLLLRVSVTGGGCSGLRYGFSFDETIHDDDVRIARGPITVVVDAISLQYLAGAEIDFEDALEGARFVIRNPNAATTCGCGSSFSI